MSKLKHILLQSAGWLFFLSLLMGLALLLPASTFDSESKNFIFLIGAVACGAKCASWAKRQTRPTYS